MCLGILSNTGSTSTSYCMPQQKPAECSQQSWQGVQTTFKGEQCYGKDIKL